MAKPKKDFFLNKLLSAVELLQALKEIKKGEIGMIDTFIDSLIQEMEEEKKKEKGESKEEEQKPEPSGKPETKSKKKPKASTAESFSKSAKEEVLKEIIDKLKKGEMTEELWDKRKTMTPMHSILGEEDTHAKSISEMLYEDSSKERDIADSDEPVRMVPGGIVASSDKGGMGKVWCPVCNEYHEADHVGGVSEEKEELPF